MEGLARETLTSGFVFSSQVARVKKGALLRGLPNNS